MLKRTTLYAAFSEGVPVLNVWDFDKKRLETRISDRIANGEALPNEKAVQCTVAFYNRKLAEQGLPPIRPETDAAAARVAGRQKVASKTVWRLNLGSLAVRCIREGSDRYRIESQEGQGPWQPRGESKNAFDALEKIAKILRGTAREVAS